MHSIANTERSLIGICLTNSKPLTYITATLKPQDFTEPKYKYIFEAIQTLYNQSLEVDIVTVSDRLQKDDRLELVGGRSEINDIALECISTAGYKSYIKLILDSSKRKQLKKLANNIISLADTTEDIDKTIVSLNAKATKILTRTEQDNIPEISDGAIEVFNDLERMYESGEPLGLATPFPKLNNLLGGLQGGKLYILAARPSSGKGLELDCPILTQKGWVKNKDIKVGDFVIGRDGKETKVIGVYPQPLQDCYKIYLKDGREIVCDSPHEWTVKLKDKGLVTLTTEELYNKLQKVRYQQRTSLVSFSGDYGIEKDFIIPPYVMGVLIGDGCLTRGALCYSKPSEYVFNNIKALLPNINVHFSADKKTVYLSGWEDGRKYIKQSGLKTQSYNKFIPQEYFHSSKKQRLELFNGLMDTDGYKSGKECWEYSTTSKQLSLDVQQLAWSLGYNCRICTRMGKYKKDGRIIETRINYRVFITKLKPLTIVKIEKTKPIPTQCIHVDNEDKLFVIKDYLVTHNTCYAINIAEGVAEYKNVLVFSLEMQRKELAKRIMLKKSKTNGYLLQQGRVNADIVERMTASLNDIAGLNMFVEDRCPCTPSKVELGILNTINSKGSCDLVIIDYLQLMDADSKTKDRQAAISDISRKLKQLANKYNVPIIALSQLSRALESRENKRPILSDLRESGAIEQDADVVMFVYRDEMYNNDITNKGRAEVIIAKQRDGELGKIDYIFNGSQSEFIETKGF